MSLQPRQRLYLRDGQNRHLGDVSIDRIEGDLVFGGFTPGPDYAGVQSLFAEYVETANQQLLHLIGELDEAISRLGLRLDSPDGAELPSICDVQIGEGVINFRLRPSGHDQPMPGAPPSPPSSTPVIDHDLRPA